MCLMIKCVAWIVLGLKNIPRHAPPNLWQYPPLNYISKLTSRP